MKLTVTESLQKTTGVIWWLLWTIRMYQFLGESIMRKQNYQKILNKKIIKSYFLNYIKFLNFSVPITSLIYIVTWEKMYGIISPPFGNTVILSTLGLAHPVQIRKFRGKMLHIRKFPPTNPRDLCHGLHIHQRRVGAIGTPRWSEVSPRRTT